MVRETVWRQDGGLTVTSLMHGPEMIVTLLDRLVGRTLFETITEPETGAIIAKEGDVISEDQAKQTIDAGIEEATIRSVFMCNTKHRSEEHTSELQSRGHLVCRLLLEKKKYIMRT